MRAWWKRRRRRRIPSLAASVMLSEFASQSARRSATSEASRSRSRELSLASRRHALPAANPPRVAIGGMREIARACHAEQGDQPRCVSAGLQRSISSAQRSPFAAVAPQCTARDGSAALEVPSRDVSLVIRRNVPCVADPLNMTWRNVSGLPTDLLLSRQHAANI